MSVYKVPQDVEAEDKLLGPFSFKQFIFLLISAMGIAMAYGLYRVWAPLVAIPLPIVLLFGTLALPLKKDQPMEVYLSAVISFILKPKIRLWDPDGIQTLVKIVAPKIDEPDLNKGYGQAEVDRRLSYLADLVDSEGWAVRGVDNPDNPMRQELYNEARAVDDFLDDDNARARQIDSLMSQSDMRRRQEMIYRMHNPAQVPQLATPQTTQQIQPTYSTPAQPVAQVVAPTDNTSPQQPVAQITPPQATPPTDGADNQSTADDDDEPVLEINPYPSDMKQAVLSPVSTAAKPDDPGEIAPQPANNTPRQQSTPSQPEEPKTSVSAISPAIMDLANNKDLSIEVIQREANRIDKRAKELEEEVVISLH